MDDALLMSSVERFRHLQEKRESFVDRDRSFLNTRLESFPLDELHHQKVRVKLFETVEGRDPWMVQRREQRCLALETRQALFVLRERFG